MARSRPWLRLDANYMSNPIVRLAGCAAVYPWVLAVLKQTGNEAEDMDLDPRICGMDLGLPVEVVDAQIKAMQKHGLLIRGEDGFWRDPAWNEHQIDPRMAGADRAQPRKNANRPASIPSTTMGTPMGAPGATGSAWELPSGNVPRAGARLDKDIGQGHRTEDKDTSPKRATTVEPLASAGMGARPASPGGKWWERMGEEHGLGAIPTRQMGADGNPATPARWTFGGLKIALQTLWPREPVLQPGHNGVAQIFKFINELCDEPAEDIDRLLETVAPQGVLADPARLPRPYNLRGELERMRNGNRPRGGQPAPREDLTAVAFAGIRDRLAKDPAELWELAQALAAAGESTDDEKLRVMIADEYTRRGLKIPPPFRPKASAA